MADIDINKVQEEWHTIFDFIWHRNFDNNAQISWYDYCEKYRNGRQDLEEMEKLFSSLFDANPWRIVVYKSVVGNIILRLIKSVNSVASEYDSEKVVGTDR